MDEQFRELSNLLKGVEGKSPAERRKAVMEVVSSTISKTFSLGPDEIAVLLLSPDRMMVRFVWPPELAAGGNSFPVTIGSLANDVIQSERSLLSNAVRELRHLAFYERIRIQEHNPRAIQKLLAVPLKGADGQVKGVIEISRRGQSRAESGKDFRPEDQLALEKLAALAVPALEVAFGTLRF